MQFRASDLPDVCGSIAVCDFAVLVSLSALLWHPGKLKNLPLLFRVAHQDKSTPVPLSHIFSERNALPTLTFTEVSLNSKKIEWQNLAEKLSKEKYSLRKGQLCLASERKAPFSSNLASNAVMPWQKFSDSL